MFSPNFLLKIKLTKQFDEDFLGMFVHSLVVKMFPLLKEKLRFSTSLFE